MTYALETLEQLRSRHPTLEVAWPNGVPVIRCKRCGHTVIPSPE
jgi:hypothetical protein